MPKLKQYMMPCCEDENFAYFQWIKDGNFYQRKSIEETVKLALLKFEKSFKDFRLHKYLARTQRAAYKEKKENLKSTEALLVVDFSEKFISKARREIQASYFGKKLISVFTAKIFTEKENFSFIIASDEQSQTKDEVYAYLKEIIDWLKVKNPKIKHLIVFSDGSASQFKNKFNFLNLLYAKKDFGLTIEWHFFCTSHGKSECDGLGGTIKRGVHRRAIASDFHVYSAKEFVYSAKAFIEKTEVVEVTSVVIASRSKKVKKRWENAKTIAGTQGFHFFWPSDKKGYLNASMTSSGENYKEFKMI
jgi:hypothetical protein